MTDRTEILLEGKPVQFFIDEIYQRAFVIDYQSRNISVIDIENRKIVQTLSKSSYPIHITFHVEWICVSDFWGHKIDIYQRDTLTYLSSLPCKRGPAFSLERGGLLYVASQLEPELQIFHLATAELLFSFPLQGRVPIFYLLDDVVILPYYDNYHTWSQDFEMVDSVAFLNPTTFVRWNIEGKTKKPLHVLRLDTGKYLIVGYLDNGLWSVDWGQREVAQLVSWKGHTHIMDVALFAEKLAVTSMSENDLFFYDFSSKQITKVALTGGIIDIENYDNQYLFGISNFENTLYVVDSTLQIREKYPIPDYPISMKIWKQQLFILTMDDAMLTIFSISTGEN